MVTSLLPVTNYSLRTSVVYPNGEMLYSDSVNFTTACTYVAMHLQLLNSYYKFPIQLVFLEFQKYHLWVLSYTGANH